MALATYWENVGPGLAVVDVDAAMVVRLHVWVWFALLLFRPFLFFFFLPSGFLVLGFDLFLVLFLGRSAEDLEAHGVVHLLLLLR